MQLYNTRHKTIETFIPLKGPTVNMYSCGPTVYDHIHIGNLSAFIYADTLRRALTLNDYDVHHVMNFTDVDDKTIRRSRDQYPDLDARTALAKLTTHFGDIFLKDMQRVGNDIASYEFVKATDETVITGMQRLITELHDAGFAYVADDGVYFSIEAYRKSGKTYGQLSEISVSSTSEARIQNDEYDKESAHDFALWKKQKEGEPAWEFMLDGIDMTGRPGWHIECSVMSSQNLGQPFDIHTGGIDLIFPHHENEIAQSTAGKDDPVYANIFVHNEHILVDGKKMSKSLGNFHTLADITAKGFDPLAFRVLVLQSHYRSQAHFSWENLEAAQNRLGRWREAAALRWQDGMLAVTDEDISAPAFEEALVERISNDLDTVTVLQLIDEMADKVLRAAVCLACLDTILETVYAALGIDLSVADINDVQKDLIAERQAARSDKNWAKSDDLRDRLLEQGIGLRDTAQGAIWYRI